MAGSGPARQRGKKASLGEGTKAEATWLVAEETTNAWVAIFLPVMIPQLTLFFHDGWKTRSECTGFTTPRLQWIMGGVQEEWFGRE